MEIENRFHFSRRITNLQIHDCNNRHETTGQNIKRKNIGVEENNRTDKAKHVRKEKQEEHDPGSTGLIKRKTTDKKRTDTENGKIRNKSEK